MPEELKVVKIFNYNLVKIEHLKKRKEFLDMSLSAKKVYSKSVILLYLEKEVYQDNSKNSAIRAGFTVTKKIGNAVTRNYIKRCLKSVLYDLVSDSDINGKAYDLVLIARKHIIDRKFSDLKRDIKYSFYAGGII